MILNTSYILESREAFKDADLMDKEEVNISLLKEIYLFYILKVKNCSKKNGHELYSLVLTIIILVIH